MAIDVQCLYEMGTAKAAAKLSMSDVDKLLQTEEVASNPKLLNFFKKVKARIQRSVNKRVADAAAGVYYSYNSSVSCEDEIEY